jgi:hypothetical protein
MIDVFVCSAASDCIRVALSIACLKRWSMVCRPFTIQAKNVQSFMREHRAIAEERATTPVYCVADDDCMPLGDGFLERSEEVMGRHSEYGLLAFMDALVEFREHAHHPRYNDSPEVFETHSAGGIYLVRKGLIDAPSDVDWWDDVQACGQIRAKGYKVGYFKTVHMSHLGYGLSTCFPERTGVTQFSY